MPHGTERQLSFDVARHPDVLSREQDGDGTYLLGELRVAVTVPVDVDLNPGDRLIVTIGGEDGGLLARSYAEVGPISFEPIREKDLGVIGTTRVHRAKLTDE